MSERLDPRVFNVFTCALDNDAVTAQIVLLQCFSSVFGASQWWRQMLADDPAIAALVRTANHRIMH